MSFMSCFRKSVFSSKCLISVIVHSSYQAWSNQNVSNEKPVYNPIIIFSRTSAFPTSAHKIHTTICFHLLWFYTHYKQYPPLMVQKHGTKSWHIWGVLASMSVNICDFWGSGCGTRLYNRQKHVLLIPPVPFESMCHVWAHRGLESQPFTLPTPLATDHGLTGFILSSTEASLTLSHFLCTLISGGGTKSN